MEVMNEENAKKQLIKFSNIFVLVLLVYYL